MFKGRHFDRSIILLCVRWCLAYGLSLRDLCAAGNVRSTSQTRPGAFRARQEAQMPSIFLASLSAASDPA